MRIDKKDLEWAASRGVINAAQVATLWQALTERTADRPKFDFIHTSVHCWLSVPWDGSWAPHGRPLGGGWHFLDLGFLRRRFRCRRLGGVATRRSQGSGGPVDHRGGLHDAVGRLWASTVVSRLGV